MRIGICAGTDVRNPELIKKAGFDYMETGFNSVASMSDGDFLSLYSALSESGIKCEAANCFLPGEMSVTGKNVDYDALYKFIEKGFERCKKLGTEIVVFGSGRARDVKDGYSLRECCLQTVHFLKDTVAGLCDKYDIDLAIEPLCRQETGVINTLKEACITASMTDSGRIHVLADIYHMLESGDDYANILAVGSDLIHAHISYPVSTGRHKRVYPNEKYGFDYSEFIDNLKMVGCPRVSIEGSTDDFENDLISSYEVMKKFR